MRALCPAMLMAIIAASLTSCAGGGRPSLPTRQIDRLLVIAPGQAQPSKIVAIEIAFAQLAREDGLAMAYRDLAAPGAIIHDQDGPKSFASLKADRRDLSITKSWRPRGVWTNCDGALAVSLGRYIDHGDKVGSFVTVWQRQRDGSYLWSYRIKALDVSQPPLRSVLPAAENEIVVTALDSIKGIVADCPDAATPLAAPPRQAILAGERQGRLDAADGTLRIVWRDHGDGRVDFNAMYFADGGWKTALDQSFAVAS